MIRTSLLAATVFALAALAASAADARRGNISFDVQNRTGYTLVALHTGPSSSNDWGPNILSGRIPSGQTVTVTISDPRSCEFDFRYVFTGKETFEEYEIDICSIDGEEFVIR